MFRRAIHAFFDCFNTQPPEGGWTFGRLDTGIHCCFNTQPPEGGWTFGRLDTGIHCCFNTQPPEGGWPCSSNVSSFGRGFNTQPPEGGWLRGLIEHHTHLGFQHAAARRRLAKFTTFRNGPATVSTRSRPKAAGTKRQASKALKSDVSTRSRPKAAGCKAILTSPVLSSFNTQPPEGGWRYKPTRKASTAWFQHAAARRRLATRLRPAGC